jgi:hypothetical protein
LQQQELTDDDVKLALAHLISQALFQASELETTHWTIENLDVYEIAGYDMDRITSPRFACTGFLES